MPPLQEPGLAPGFLVSGRSREIFTATAQAAHGTMAGMDIATGQRRIAQRFLISILQQYGREAPAVLRESAEELEALEAELESGDGPSDPGASARLWG